MNITPVASFLYGNGFWYGDPLREVRGLAEEQLYWVPDPGSLCILWHVGHTAHRERLHFGKMMQGLPGEIIPAGYDVFGHRWHSPDEVRAACGSVQEVFDWVTQVRAQSWGHIASLTDTDWAQPVRTPDSDLSVAHWIMITAVHTGVHIGRIQMLRAMIEGEQDRPC